MLYSLGVENGVLQLIEVSKLRPSKFQFRLASELEIDELAASIKEHGLLHPLIVRPMEGHFEVVAGNRRLAALRALGWRKALCYVVDLSDKEALELAIIENLQRRNFSPIEEAMAYKRYVEAYGWGSISELARKIGKSQEYISRRLQLLRLPQEVQKEIIRRRISPNTAAELVALKDSRKIVEVAGKIVEKKLSREQVRQIIRAEKLGYPTLNLEEDDRKAKYERIVNKCISALKLALVHVDDAVESASDNWLLREILLEHRLQLHNQIDQLIRLKRKIARTRVLTNI